MDRFRNGARISPPPFSKKWTYGQFVMAFAQIAIEEYKVATKEEFLTAVGVAFDLMKNLPSKTEVKKL